MPFIRGRYHINPIAGEALEAAREAEAALLALEHAAQQGAEDQGDGFGYDHPAASPQAKGPIRRVEIEAAELVPSHSGRASHGFVARVHRHSQAAGSVGASSPGSSASPRDGGAGAVPGSETHVFTDHRDLLGYLRDEFAKDCSAK
jgi:hypothetical protein